MDDAVCRVCGDSGSAEYPLYHPCNCSGSIRHIHEKCLIKWLLIKSDHSKNQVPDTPSAMSTAPPKGTKCEICGFEYQFLPVYSPQYRAATSLSVRTNLILLSETIKSILTGLRGVLAPILSTLMVLLVFPFIVGVTALSIWLHTLGDFYGVSSVFEVVEHFGFVLSIGYIAVSVGLIAGYCGTAYMGSFGTSYLGVSILGLFFSWSLWTTLVLAGRSLWLWIEVSPMQPILWTNALHDCQCFLMGTSALLSTIGLPLFVFSGQFRIGYAVVGSTYDFLTKYTVQSSIGALGVYLLNVDECILVAEVKEIASEFCVAIFSIRSTFVCSIIAILLYTTVGSMLMFPVSLVNELLTGQLWSRSFKRWVKLPSNGLCGTLFGRFTNGGNFCCLYAWLTTLSAKYMVVFASCAFVLFSVYAPSMYFLSRLGLIPIEMERISSSTKLHADSQVVLPFELFYAHVLVPLVLTVPPIPRSVADRWTTTRDLFRTKIFALPPSEPSNIVYAKLILKSILLRHTILYALVFTLVGCPVVLGKLLLSGRQDILAYAIGCLTLLAAIQISLRAVHALEKLKVGRGDSQLSSEGVRPSQEAVSTNILSKILSLSFVFVHSVLAFFCTLVVLPLTVGGAFQVAVITPLKEIQKSEFKVSVNVNGVVSSAVASATVQLVPVWIIGLMLLKITIAMHTILGSARVSTSRANPVTGNPEQPFYGLIEGVEERGLLDTSVQRDLIRKSVKVSGKIALHVFGPLMVALAMERADVVSAVTRKHVPAIYLLCCVIMFDLVPEINRYLRAKREMAFSKVFIVKRQLCNRESDVVVGREAA